LPGTGVILDEVERAFGAAIESSERHEGSLRVLRMVFVADDRRITADFVEDVLVRYTVTSR
jgi:hypothetical protein